MAPVLQASIGQPSPHPAESAPSEVPLVTHPEQTLPGEKLVGEGTDVVQQTKTKPKLK